MEAEVSSLTEFQPAAFDMTAVSRAASSSWAGTGD